MAYLKHRPMDIVELDCKMFYFTGQGFTKILLEIQLWLRFSLASAFVEKYKQQNVQKSKGIRKQLQTHSTNTDKELDKPV